MNILKTIILDKYKDNDYEFIEESIYRNKKENTYHICLYTELSKGEDSQNPLEDLLDNFCVACTDYIVEGILETKNCLIFELFGDFENILEIKNLIGKKVFVKEDNGVCNFCIEKL